MQQNKKMLYAAPRVKSVKFLVEQGYICSQDDCNGLQMKSMLENYKADYDTLNMFGDVTPRTGGGSTSNE